MKIIHISVGGPTHEIKVSGKTYCFEMHRYCGPMMTDMKGNALKHEPLHVLEAIGHWDRQGRRLDANGRCIWEKPAPEPWSCACQQRNEAGVLTAIGMQDPSTKRCRVCGMKRSDAP